MKFDRSKYSEVIPDLKNFESEENRNLDSVIKWIFKGSLKTGDIIEHKYGDIFMIAPQRTMAYPLKKDGEFSKKPVYCDKLYEFKKLVKI